MAKLAQKQILGPVQHGWEKIAQDGMPWSDYQKEPWINSEKAIKRVEQMLEEEPERFMESTRKE